MSLIPINEPDDPVNEFLLSVIIVNYNGLSFLETCLQSLFLHLSCPHEIIVVDNNSSDGSREYLTKVWPDVKLICNPHNSGFAGGNNLGAETARGRILLLLNNDTKILEPLQPLFTYLEDHPGTAVVGGRLRNPDGSTQGSVGYDHTPLRILFSWILPRTFTWLSSWQLYEKRPDFYRQDHHEVDWVSGAFLCIRRSIWQELHGFDQDIFMYVEDVDLCRRVREGGGKVAFMAGADTCHFEGGGKKGLSGHALMATIDSYRLLLAKQYSSMIRNLTCAGLAVIFLVRAILYGLVGAIRRDPVNKGKAGFFFKGAGRLIMGGARNLSPRSHGERHL